MIRRTRGPRSLFNFYKIGINILDNQEDLTEVSEYFFKEAVDLKYRPDLILSIIGDTKYLKIVEEVKTAFKKLIRTSRELDTWNK